MRKPRRPSPGLFLCLDIVPATDLIDQKIALVKGELGSHATFAGDPPSELLTIMPNHSSSGHLPSVSFTRKCPKSETSACRLLNLK